jgi:cyclophilin family peptidyl-prolyl cis-trans isomerase
VLLLSRKRKTTLAAWQRRVGGLAVNRLCLIATTILLGALSVSAAEKKTVVVMETSLGRVKIELDPEKAPITVKNFLGYVEDRFYDGTLFHRVAKNPAVIQGGGYQAGLKEKKTKPPIKNEAANALSNKPYTIAMARTNEPDSATSQFYINVKDNDFIEKAKDPDNVGYCVFGKVVEGMDIVDKIFAVKTSKEEVPLTDVVIRSVRIEK